MTEFISMFNITNILLILGLQLLYVPLLTLKTIFIVKGKKRLATVISILESYIFVYVLGIMVSNLGNPVNMFCFVIAYAGGVYVGCILEEKMAIGYRTVSVNLLKRNNILIKNLKKAGFGITLFEGEGINGDKRLRLDILTSRQREKDLIKIIEIEEPKAFIVSYEPTNFRGGYIINQIKKYATFK